MLRKELETVQSQEVIEPSASEWCSSIVLISKNDGTIRFCVDFQQMRALSKLHPYPIPCIDELVERLGMARYISTLDLCEGYWQAPRH